MKLVDIDLPAKVNSEPILVKSIDTLTNPYMSKLTTLDKQLTAAAQENDINAYDAALHQYLKTYNKLRGQQTLKNTSAHGAGENEISKHKNLDIEKTNAIYRDVIENIPKNLQKNARRLIAYVKESPHFIVNSRGELMVKGELIKDSHIEDLITHSIQKRGKQQYVPGLTEFHEVLHQDNIPLSILARSSVKAVPKIFDAEGKKKIPLPLSVKGGIRKTRKKKLHQNRNSEWVYY